MRKWSKAPRVLALLTVMLAAALGFAPTAGAEGAGELQGKIDAAESGSTIVSDKDYTESVTIRNGKKHTLVKVDAVAPTCETDGVLAHWKCSSCGDLFLDEAMTKPTDNVVDPKLGHSAVKVPAKDPTIEAEGNIEYWHCAACDSYFADAQLTKKLSSKADTVLAKLPKEFTVTFDDGVHDPTTVKVKDGELVAKPKDPEHDGWKFVGWFMTKAADGTVSGEWDFGKDAVTADMALYGGWKKIEAGETEKPQNKLLQTGDTSAIGVVVLGVAGVAAVAAGAPISKRRKAE